VPVSASAARPLRIAQIAPAGTAVRRGVGESVEQLVALMCDELVARGHEVTLFATGDSETTAELRSYFDRGYEHDDELWDWQFTEYMHVGHAYSQADEFDVIHCHSYHFGLPFVPFVRRPNFHTHHVEMEPGVVAAYLELTQVHLVAVSRWQAQIYGARANLALVPHGIETASFPFGETGGDYLLFLGRMIEDKGPAKAIEIARAVGMPLVLAGPAEEGFDENVAPQIDGRQITYVGRVDPAERNRLLAGAAALLYPLLYPEPFGLVVVEAMACGTPVLGTAVGAVPELVEPGLTGYLAPSWEGLADLVPRALELDRSTIRARAVQRFDYTRMVDLHEELYQRSVLETDR
jgi:glycosyltransferase involved in cell wall biosynthesis